MKKDIVRGRPSVIPKEDYAQIIADVISGKRKPSEIAKEYKKPDGTPIAQSNINRIVEEFRAKQNLSKRDTEDMVATIDNIVKMQIELQATLNKYEKVGNIIYAQCVEQQRIKLQAYGYAPLVKKFKDKINTLLDNDEVYDILGRGEGVQHFEARKMSIQDFGSIEKGVNTLQKLSLMECVTQTTPTVAIQNNSNNEAKVETARPDIQKISIAQDILASALPQHKKEDDE